MLNLLRKIPGVGPAIGFVTGKFRLVIEYALIAAVVTLAGVAVALWGAKKRTEVVLAHTETRLTSTEGRLTTVEAINQAHEATIADLHNLREKDSLAITGLLDDYKTLHVKDQQMRDLLNDLETHNATVKSYLDQPVPADLVRLLTGAGATGNQGSHKDRSP